MNKKYLTNLPNKPGCYLFKNSQQQTIYIGKAKNLSLRIKSYFTKNSELSPAKKIMLQEIHNIETVIVDNETEALLLEKNLIKKYQPKYNIDLKDDKNFCYVKISQTTPPNITIERQIKNDRATYFGPYLSAAAVRKTLALFWQKGPGTFKKEFKESEYLTTIKQIKRFFQGDTKAIINELKKKMSIAAEKKNYELATIYRNRLQAIEKISQKQKVVSTKLTSQDVISIFTWRQRHALNLFRIRQGKIIDKLNFIIDAQTTDKKHILGEFIQNYYTQTKDQPKQIIIDLPLSKNKITINQKKIIISYKKSGRLKKIITLGNFNAQEYLAKKIPSFYKTEKNELQAILNLTNKLALPNIPKRIECYDISNIQGSFAVGAMVVFTNGQPDKSQYRKFKIKYTQGINDFAMMAEIIARRFTGNKNWPWPDLVIIDGGKGQLSSVKKTLHQLKISLPLIALAKKNEEIFFPEKKSSLRLPTNSVELKLLQRIRDEAHRFAITYYRLRHKRQNIKLG